MNHQLNQSVVNATEEVFENMLGLQVRSGIPEQRAINQKSDETSVVINFVGDISGAFTLQCSSRAAACLAGKMLGMDVEPNSEEMKDAAGELLNMIVGLTKTNYSTNNAFNMSVPTIISGGDYSVHIKADSSDIVSYIPFSTDGVTLAIEVYVK